MKRGFKFEEFGVLESPSYPVGSDMVQLMKSVRSMVEVFKALHRKHSWNIDKITLWCRGSSGAIIAGMFGSLLFNEYSITIQHVKKKGEESHYSYNKYDSKSFNMIVDDFISTGRTMQAIMTGMTQADFGACLDLILVGGHTYWDTNYVNPNFEVKMIASQSMNQTMIDYSDTRKLEYINELNELNSIAF